MAERTPRSRWRRDRRRAPRRAPRAHRPALRRGREVRAVGLDEQAVAGDLASDLAELLRARVGDVAGERNVVAAVERDRQELGRGEAVQDDGALEAFERLRRLVRGRARMNDDGFAELGRQLEVALEELALAVMRRVVAVEVEPGLADRDGALVAEELAELVEVLRVLLGSLMGMDPKRGEDS